MSRRTRGLSAIMSRNDAEDSGEDVEDVLPILRQKLRQHYRLSLFDFCRDLLGFSEMERDVHGELCRLLEDSYWGRSKVGPSGGISRHIYLLPRGTFKTSIVTTGFVLWVLVQDEPPFLAEQLDGDANLSPPPKSFNGKKGYNQRFLIGTEVEEYANKFLQACKDHISSNQRFIELYGRLDKSIGDARLKWSREGFNISWRDDFASRDFNAAAVSLDGAVNSVHTDINIFDDLFCNRQTDTPGGIAKTYDFYKRILPVAENPSILMLVGVRWHDSDLFGHLMKTEAGKWNIYIERAIRTEKEQAAGKPELFFPSRLSMEVLNDKRTSMTDYEFSCNYLNDPIDQSTALFKESYFKNAYYEFPTGAENVSGFLRGKYIYTTVDLAIDDDDDACNTVLLTCAWDDGGHVWTIDMIRERGMSPGDVIEEIFRQHELWRPMAIGIEEQVYQKALMFFMGEEMRRRKVYPYVVGLRHNNKAKPRRIKGLEPIAKTGRMHFKFGHESLVHEMTRYPNGEYDDAVDALAYQIDIAKAPMRPTGVPEPPKYPTKADIDKQFQEHLAAMNIGLGGSGMRPSWMAY